MLDPLCDLDLGLSRSNFEIAEFQELGGQYGTKKVMNQL